MKRMGAGRAWIGWMMAAWALARADAAQELPKVPDGWTIELVKQAPEILYPTAIVVAPDGTVYLGQDPMDMPGPPTQPIDSVVAIRPDGSTTVFAEKLWAVMGLEWIDDTLYVVHAPFLSAFRDTNGDFRADERVDLVTGLGPPIPGFSGINDHVPSGVRLGMDGYLYIAVGDKGIPKATGKDGATIELKGGGVIRVRPDGSGLEVVSTGERNPLSVALSATDEIFTYGNDDDSKKWPNSLTHHIVGGHYGYPYEFLLRPDRCLPIVAGQIGGSGAQGICYLEDGLPEDYVGDFLFCDWGLQQVIRYRLRAEGGTYRMVGREPIITAGALADFRPFSIAASPVDGSLYLVDWAYNGWLDANARSGRLFRISYQGAEEPRPKSRPNGDAMADWVNALDHPSHATRLQAQRVLAARGEEALPAVLDRFQKAEPPTGRLHALWTLDAMGTEAAHAALREALTDPSPEIRLQAARRTGLRRDTQAVAALTPLLRDPEPRVRREAAIALGRIGGQGAAVALYPALDEKDPFTAWAVRDAIRDLKAWDAVAITTGLNDPARRENILRLTDEAWSTPVAAALAATIKEGTVADPAVRARIVENLAGILLAYPAWNGAWFGTNPLAGTMPRKTDRWDKEGMTQALLGLIKALGDSDAKVRGAALVGLRPAGPSMAPYLRARLSAEDDAENLRALVLILGELGDTLAVPELARLLGDASRPEPVRLAVIDTLGAMQTPDGLRARFSLVFDSKAPHTLVAHALPGLASSGTLPPNDLASFLEHPAPSVRAAAVRGLAAKADTLPDHLKTRLVAKLDDADAAVLASAVDAVAALRDPSAVPRLIELAEASGPTHAPSVRALAALADPRAVPIYVKALEDRNPDVRLAAETALLTLRDPAKAAIDEAARTVDPESPAAVALERLRTRFLPITQWKVIGPFARTTARVFLGEPSIDFSQPHSGVEGRPVSWQDRKADPETGRVLIDDFKMGAGDRGGFGYDTTGSPDLAAFAYAEIESAADRPAMLLIGSSGSLLVELNGQLVHDFSRFSGRGYAPDSDRVRVQLARGTNRLVLRSRQGIGAWSFSVQVSEPSASLLASRPASQTGRSFDALLAHLSSNPGDPSRGKAIFFDADGVGCVKCHAIGEDGTSDLGPNLAGLAAKYGPDEILRSLIEPSARIATGYQPALIALTDGQVLNGLLRGESPSEIELVNSEAQIVRIAKSRIEDQRIGSESVMPLGLVDALSPDEIADLVAYMTTLKSPAPSTSER